MGALGGDPANHNCPANSLRRPLHSSLVRKCAYAAFERAVEPLHSAISSFRPPNSSFPRRRESRGGVWVANDAHATPPVSTSVFILWCAGASWNPLALVIPAKAGIQRGGGRQDPRQSRYESMSRTPIRDRPLRQPLIRHSRHPFVNPAPQSSFRRRPESRGVGRGACPPPRAPLVRPRCTTRHRHIRGPPANPIDSGFRRNPRKARTAQPSRTLESLSGLHQLVQDRPRCTTRHRHIRGPPANPIFPAFAGIQERHGRRNRPGHLNPSQTSINSCRIIASRILCKTNVSAYQHLAGR